MVQNFLAGDESYLKQQVNNGSSRILKQHALLATKRYIPSLRPEIVLRPRLTEQLSEGMMHKLTCLSAPAGFGKTTLLSERARQSSCPVVWVSLDKNDNDLIHFWCYIIDALETLHEGVGEHALALLHAPQPPAFDAILTTLMNALSVIPEHFVLILDDYHAIVNPAIHEAMAFLLHYSSPYMHLVIASRTPPPLPLARLRVHGQLIDIDATDLLFTLDEAIAFFKQTVELPIPEEIVALLQARTEGWIAGLQLAAFCLQHHQDAKKLMATFNGGHAHVMDYFNDEVFSQQPENIQTFLLHTALVDRFNSSLCDALTEKRDGQTMLECLMRARLFLVSLDEEKCWYRYSQIFRDFLWKHLQQAKPEMIAALHQRASLWFEQNNLSVEAVNHALAARDFERAVALIQDIGETLMNNGEVPLLSRWLDALPEHLLRAQPRLCPLFDGPQSDHGLRFASAALQTNALSAREIELIGCIASGMSDEEVAQQMVIARSTVQWHLKNIYSKIDVHSRTQLLVRTRKLGLVE